MAEKPLFNFDETEETKQVKRVRDAGIYSGVKYMGIEYKKVEVNDKGEKKGGYAILSFEIPKEIKAADGSITETQKLLFDEMVFPYATKEADIKYFADHYENGTAIRKNTPAEQMASDAEGFFIKMLQLGVAFGIPFATVKAKLRPAASDPENGFIKAIDIMRENFPVDKVPLIDIKLIWKNDKDKKTSFLRLGYSNNRKLAFAQHIPGQETKLFLDDYDLKLMKPQFTGNANPPKTNEAVIPGANGEMGWAAGPPLTDVSGNKVDTSSPLF